MIVDSPESIAQLVRLRRKALGLTQTELAELSGVSLRFVFDLENAKPTVAMDRFRLVAKALGLSLSLEVRRVG
jgi:y4mF family transcriptional regulator